MRIFKSLLTMILCIILLLFSSALVGCNRQVIDVHYEFETIHIYETGKCYKIKSWKDFRDGDQIQVKLEDDTILLLHATDCCLVKGECPFCKDGEE